MTHYTRRTLLAAAGGFTASLAGCLGIGSGENSSSSETDESGGETAVIRDARVEGTDLVIELGEETTVDRLTIIDPTGEAFADRALTPGAKRLTLRIGTWYRPGEYRVLALREGEQIAESVLEIAPDVEIVDVRAGANHLDEMPDSLGNTRDVEMIVDIKNSGSGPVVIRGVIFKGDVPNPTDEVEIRADNARSGIHNINTGGDLEEVVLLGQDQVTLYSSTLPLSWARRDEACWTREGIVDLSVLNGAGIDVATRRISVEYIEGKNAESCQITLWGR